MTSGGRFTDRALSLSKNESRQSSVSGCERPPTAKPSAPPQPTTTPHRPSTTPRRRPTSTDSRRRHRSSCLRLPPASQAPPPQFQGTGGLHLAEVPLRPEGHGEGDGRKVRLQRVQEVVRASWCRPDAVCALAVETRAPDRCESSGCGGAHLFSIDYGRTRESTL